MPSQRFGVNSVWFKISLLTYNLVSVIKGLCLEGEERTARMKRFRLLLIHVAGRMNRNNCVMGLRLCHDAAALKRMQRVWQVFELPTQATSQLAIITLASPGLGQREWPGVPPMSRFSLSHAPASR